MDMKRKMKTTKAKATATATSTFYCYFCSRHILITFVAMALLIVNYGVNTVQMSAVPHRNGNSSRNVKLSADSKDSIFRKILLKRSIGNTTKLNNKSVKNLPIIALPETPTFHKRQENSSTTDSSQLRFNSNTALDNHTEFDQISDYLRKPRLFGLFGSNFSLSYNLSLSTGTSAGNITVVAPSPPAYYYYVPAPAYYYAPAPDYYYAPAPAPAPYPYYDPYAYNPYAYSPYTYDPYAGYSYYG